MELTTDLPPVECLARVASAIDRDAPPSVLGERPVIGRVSGRSVRLRMRVRAPGGFDVGNPFLPVLEGWFSPRGAGAVFHGTAGPRPFGCVYGAAVLGLVALALVTVPGLVLAGAAWPLALLVFPVGVGAVAGLTWCMWRVGLAEERFLAEFLARTIESGSANSTGPRTTSDLQ